MSQELFTHYGHQQKCVKIISCIYICVYIYTWVFLCCLNAFNFFVYCKKSAYIYILFVYFIMNFYICSCGIKKTALYIHICEELLLLGKIIACVTKQIFVSIICRNKSDIIWRPYSVYLGLKVTRGFSFNTSKQIGKEMIFKLEVLFSFHTLSPSKLRSTKFAWKKGRT